MKYILLLFIVLIGSSKMIAQSKEDFTWVMGYNPNDSLKGYGGTLIDFSNGEPLLSYFPIPFDVWAGTQICDTNGKPLFYTNGCKIANFQHQLILNGDGINPGAYHDKWCDKDDSPYRTYQGMIV